MCTVPEGVYEQQGIVLTYNVCACVRACVRACVLPFLCVVRYAGLEYQAAKFACNAAYH